MFENINRELDNMGGSFQHKTDILPDDDGYYDKECPNEDCEKQFKIFADDWDNAFTIDEIHCPFCGHVASSGSWWTSEQIEHANEQAFQHLSAKIGKALDEDCKEFNRSQKHGLVNISMKFNGMTYVPNTPAEALDEMVQKITCEKCGVRYAVIGSAFYCPCCGHNSAKQTFFTKINKVKSKIKNLERITDALVDNKDDAAWVRDTLLESSISDLVTAFQRLCECIYPQIPKSIDTKKNVFQRLDDGGKLWKDLVDESYRDWVSPKEYALLVICFQRRHVLQHNDGIVDPEYIEKSGDDAYSVGQRLIVKKADILVYANIVENIGNKILRLVEEE